MSVGSTARHAQLLLFLAPLAACDRAETTPRPAPSSEPVVASTAPAASSAPSAAPSALPGADPLAALSNGPVVREEASVVVDGVTEKWGLEWVAPPAPDCVDAASFGTCGCAAFAFGEKGDLDLVRARPGAPEERLHLGPLFKSGHAQLRRWPVTKADTGKSPDVFELMTRPIETVMKLGDYDHDGRATEMVLAVGSEPCGHQPSVAVGISRSNPALHVFAATDVPDEPLVLPHPEDWEKVRAKPAVDLVAVGCRDLGATSSTSLHVTADGELHVKETTTACH